MIRETRIENRINNLCYQKRFVKIFNIAMPKKASNQSNQSNHSIITIENKTTIFHSFYYQYFRIKQLQLVSLFFFCSNEYPNYK